MNDGYAAILAFPLLPTRWVLGVRGDAATVQAIDFLPPRPLRAAVDSWSANLAAQLAAYFCDPSHRFDFARDDSRGSPFQRRVWAFLQQIPPGETRTYGELAAALGSSARAVGNACRHNPLPLLVPCHRVIARSAIGGYAGSTVGGFLPIKQVLLAHESRA